MHDRLDSPGASANVQRATRWVIFLGGAIGVASLCLAILRPFAGVIAWSAALAVICTPVHQRLVRRTRRVALSAFLTSMLTVLAFVVPLVFLGGVAVTQCVALGHTLQDALGGHSDRLTWLAATVARLTGRLGLAHDAIPAWIRQHVSELTQGLAQHLGSIATSAVDALVSSVLVFFALFLLLRDGDRIVGSISDLLPFERRRSQALLQRIKEAVQGSVYGIVVVAALQGALYGAMFWLLGVPSAALWGAVTMFASLLPVVGSFTVWGPVAAYLALSGEWPRAIVLAAWALVVSAIDHFLKPRLVAGRVGLSELVMLFAMLGGLRVLGGLGIVLGPVVFATAAAIVDTLRAPYTD